MLPLAFWRRSYKFWWGSWALDVMCPPQSLWNEGCYDFHFINEEIEAWTERQSLPRPKSHTAGDRAWFWTHVYLHPKPRVWCIMTSSSTCQVKNIPSTAPGFPLQWPLQLIMQPKIQTEELQPWTGPVDIPSLVLSNFLGKRSANYNPRSKSGPLPVCANEVLLAQSHMPSFTYCLWLLSCYKSTVE